MNRLLLSFVVIATTGAVNAQILTANDSISFSTWTTHDADLDGENWNIEALNDGTAMDAAGECMVSNSYDNQASLPLTPDNLLMSPAMDCSGETSVFVSWTVGSPEPANNWWEEHYAVYVVTDLVPLIGGTFPTPVFETTLAVGGEFIFEDLDITAEAAGQGTVYLVYRHYNCTEKNWMIVDDVVVSNASSASIEEGSIVAKVYPNPTEDVLNVVSSVEATSVSIIGMDGKVISTQTINGTTTTVDVAKLTAGVYFYEVVSAHGIIRNTFVKK